MASNINPNNIDNAYPIAGQDNDSQGFRDNFTNIKTNFEYAEEEIDDLQSKVLLKSALTGTSLDNDLEGAVLQNAKLKGTRFTKVETANTAGNVSVDFSAAQFHNIGQLTGNATLGFSNIPPAGNYAEWTVQFSTGVVPYTITLPSSVSVGNAAVEGNDANNVVTTDSSTTYAYRFATYDGGTTIGVEDMYSQTSVEGLGDVNLTSLADGEILQYDSGNTQWTNTTIAEISNIAIGTLTDVTVSSESDNDLLQYDSGTGEWQNVAVTTVGSQLSVSNLNDVTVSSVADNDYLRYSSSENAWVNISENQAKYPVEEIAVTAADDGSTNQTVFFFDGTAIKTSAGVISAIEFESNKVYRFDVSDSSVTTLKFSTTPDTAVPTSITDYTTNVINVGTPGTAGAYVEILITDDTPSPLYFWDDDSIGDVRDSALIGGAVPNPVKKTGSVFTGFETVDSNVALSTDLSTSIFTSSANVAATLAGGVEGQIKMLSYSNASVGNSVVTVTDAAWGSTVTLANTGSGCTLQYVNSAWFCVGANDVVFA